MTSVNDGAGIGVDAAGTGGGARKKSPKKTQSPKQKASPMKQKNSPAKQQKDTPPPSLSSAKKKDAATAKATSPSKKGAPSPSKTKKGSPPKGMAGKTVPRLVVDSDREEAAAAAAATTATSQAESGTPDTPATPNPVLITCKHLPAMGEFLRMYHLVAVHLRWSRIPHECNTCASVVPPIYVCLQCPVFGCWHGDTSHLIKHPHALHVECGTGVLYCGVCKVWVWTDLMAAVWREAMRYNSASSPTIRKLEALNQSVLEADGAEVRRHCVAVRGLYNLGNTCFMNCILQTMLHSPPLMRYFLSSQGPLHTHCQRPDCIACEIDRLFCKMFDGTVLPYAPNKLLELLWKYSRDLAGYEQQDAHELFVTLRNALHTHLDGAQYNCNCVVHRAFSGVLQSDLTCLLCGNVTETLDPFLDISLDIPGDGVALRLVECLGRFTGRERLHAAGYVCGACGGQGEVNKQLSIRAHPVILAIHLKRFEHGALSLKLDTPIVYEEVLSVAPFMAKPSGDPRQYEYCLYAVVSHVGGMDSGHYTAHIKRGDDWFGIDDACVSSCSKDKVLQSPEAYMLFYYRHGNQQT